MRADDSIKAKLRICQLLMIIRTNLESHGVSICLCFSICKIRFQFLILISTWLPKIFEIEGWKHQTRPWYHCCLPVQPRKLKLAKITFGFKAFSKLYRKTVYVWHIVSHARKASCMTRGLFFFSFLFFLPKIHVFLLDRQKIIQTLLLLLEEHGSIWVCGRENVNAELFHIY